MAFVFQEAQLLPWRSILDNVALPLELQGLKQKERHELVMSALAEVRLADAAEYFPHQLSGGMKMRAALAQALVTKPKILPGDADHQAACASVRAKFSLKHLLMAAAFRATHDIRYYLCGVHVMACRDGGVFVTGCDGYTLLIAYDAAGTIEKDRKSVV